MPEQRDSQQWVWISRSVVASLDRFVTYPDEHSRRALVEIAVEQYCRRRLVEKAKP